MGGAGVGAATHPAPAPTTVHVDGGWLPLPPPDGFCPPPRNASTGFNLERCRSSPTWEGLRRSPVGRRSRPGGSRPDDAPADSQEAEAAKRPLDRFAAQPGSTPGGTLGGPVPSLRAEPQLLLEGPPGPPQAPPAAPKLRRRPPALAGPRTSVHACPSFLERLQGPGSELTPLGRDDVGRLPERADARLAGAVVLRPSPRRAQMGDPE